MTRNTVFLPLFVLFTFALFVSLPSEGVMGQKNAKDPALSSSTPGEKDSAKKSSPAGSAPSGKGAAPSSSSLGEAPLLMKVTRFAGKVSAEFSRTPAKVEIRSAKALLHTYPGKGKKFFDLTPYIPGAYKGKLLVRGFTKTGKTVEEQVDVTKEIAAAQAGKKEVEVKKAAPPAPRSVTGKSLLVTKKTAAGRKTSKSTKKLPSAAGKTSLLEGATVRAPAPPVPDADQPQDRIMGTARFGGGGPPDASWLSGDSSGIQVWEPVHGSYHHYGERFNVRWVNNAGERCGGEADYSISLRRDGDPEFNALLFAGRAELEHEARLPGPTAVEEGHDYYIHVERALEESFPCWGDSYSFSVGPIREGSGDWLGVPPEVRFSDPVSGTVARVGGSIRVRWRVFPLELPYLSWGMELIDAETGRRFDGPASWGHGLPFDNETRWYSVLYNFPDDTIPYEPGTYRLRLTSSDSRPVDPEPIVAETEPFTLLAELPVMEVVQVRIVAPDLAARGHVLHVTRRQEIRWEVTSPEAAGHAWRVKLLQSGRELRTLGETRPGRMSFAWRIGSTDRALRCDDSALDEAIRAGRARFMKIRVESMTSPDVFFAETGEFEIARPAITVTSPAGGETWRNGERRSVNWASDTLGMGGSVRITLERGLMMGTENFCIVQNFDYNGGTANYPFTVGGYHCDDGNLGAEIGGAGYGTGTMGGVPPPVGDTWRARVKMEECPTIYGISSGDFTIAP